MVMLRCQTNQALLLVALADAEGVLRFPSDFSHETFYGLHVSIKPLLPVAAQILEAASHALGFDVSRTLDLCQEFADEIPLSHEMKATVFVGLVTHPEFKAPAQWLCLPDILRSMPRDRRRLPYLRALQILTGALSLNTKAVDLDEVAKHLLES